MNTKILCVDDEPNVLQGYKRSLRKDYDIYIAEGGAEALALIASDGPFAVVMSDMRMPGMDGVQFLSRVKEVAPQSVKIMLTGNADQQTAMEAVNEGNIFRFLTKPCPPETLAKTLDAALEQYRLITAEKDLLEQTLSKSLQVLVDILAIVKNPTAFSRSTRVKKMAGQIAVDLKMNDPWEIEIAAMLSQIGCVTVPEDILQKIAAGTPISDKEVGLYHQHPQIGYDLILRIPRMENVAEIVANQNRRINDETTPSLQSDEVDVLTLGSRILKVVLDFDRLINSGNSTRSAYDKLSERVGWYDLYVLGSLRRIIDLKVEDVVSLELGVSELIAGMAMDEPLLSLRGSMLLSAGQEITPSLILRLINFAETGVIGDRVRVNVPVSMAQMAGLACPV